METYIAAKHGWDHLFKYSFYYRNYYRLRKVISKMKLKMVGKTKIPKDNTEIRLFVIVRNEELRLPYFFNYYRKLGVDRFFVIDNASDDGTLDLIQENPNTHVFSTNEKFRNHWNWMESLLDKFGVGHWCLVVDADELFYYPYCENINIKKFCKFLDLHNHEAVKNLFIDIYPKGCINKTVYKKGENPLLQNAYFDDNYLKKEILHLNKKEWKLFKDSIHFGGIRSRVFKSPGMAILSKVSLIKYKKDAYLRKGMHSVDGLKYSDVNGVVFHTKFLHDIFSKTMIALKEKQHFNNSMVYKSFNKVLAKRNDIIFYSKDRSIKFENTETLIKQGFMTSSASLDLLINNI